MTDAILNYIPQRPPFVMISNLMTNHEGQDLCCLLIKKENLFVRNETFTEPGIIEHMAQSIAAITAAKQAKDIANLNTPKIGFIGAIKDLHIVTLPIIGKTICTQIQVLHQILNAQIVKAICTLEGQVIAQCEFKIFIQN